VALQSINPKNKKLIKTFDELTPAQIDKKLSDAREAFEKMRGTSIAERAKWMRQVSDILRKRKPKFAQIITDEVGKTLAAAEAEIEKCAATCDYYADNAEKFLKPEIVKSDAGKSFVRFDPIGLILAVMPWNFPFWQVFRFAAPTLMAGNVGVLKHASNVQLSADAIEEIFSESGFADNVFQNLAITSAKVEGIIRDPRINAVTLTGSEKAGAAVATVAGAEIKKTVLELGGSDPFIVLEGADIEAAVEAAVTVRLQYNGGQSCIAAKRFIIEEEIADEFTDKLKGAVERLKVGDPTDPKTDVGPLVNEQMVEDLHDQLERSVAMGAKIITGGKVEDAEGYYFKPAIITGNSFDTPVCKEETFGPVFAIVRVKDADEAVKVANESIYGLASNIYTGNAQFAQDNLAPKLEAGAVFINGPVKSDPRLPFGGVKRSGYGRELSHYGIKEFVNIKTVWVR
ncbi:MAG TPA: NAD-dependent succinate-semialdehyde dehydrogenase, partial [Candidatus Saccharimonadales bacterium]|nr:NAD-dependent succinate-semialdehyde dehydrogenase [Candidatus Saccharimonadales bacterium]